MRILTLLGLVLFPAVRASLIVSKLHTCEKIGVPTACRGVVGVGWQIGEIGCLADGRVADEKDGMGGRWERWGGWQMGEMGRVADGRDGEGGR